MRFILILLFLVGITESNAQKENSFSAIDEVALQIPDSSTHSTQAIAAYINQNFTSAADKARAAFIWIAENIQYDVENMYVINLYKSDEQAIDEVLKKHKGICMHYAELYNDIANKCSIPTYVIYGYTRQTQIIDNLPHAWCASLIDTIWRLFDPTWAAGYVYNSKFIKSLNNKYFMVEPDSLIKNHMPFDPLFQFLNYPFTTQEFYEGKSHNNKSYFNFKDSLVLYNQQNEIEKLTASCRRIESNGVRNDLILRILIDQKREAEYQKMVLYNKAVFLSNRGIVWLNDFIEYRNKRFTPKKEDAEIALMLDSAALLLNKGKEQLDEIPQPEAELSMQIEQMKREIDRTLTGNLSEQKQFLDKYLKSGKLFRKMMF